LEKVSKRFKKSSWGGNNSEKDSIGTKKVDRKKGKKEIGVEERKTDGKGSQGSPGEGGRPRSL